MARPKDRRFGLLLTRRQLGLWTLLGATVLAHSSNAAGTPETATSFRTITADSTMLRADSGDVHADQ